MLHKCLLVGTACLAGWCLLATLPAAGAAEPPAPAAPAPAAAPVPEPARRLFRFLAMADTHFWELEKHPEGLRAFEKFLADVKPLGADFAVILGDVCGDRYAALPEVRRIADDSGMKVHFVCGNHDDNYGNQPEHFEKAFGKHCYSFDRHGWHFAVHWSQKPQLQWLAEDLAKRPAGSPVILLQHYPPDKKVRELLDKNAGVLSMSGHVHGHRTGMVGKLREVTLDTFGAGFAVVDVLEDKRVCVTWRPRWGSKALTVVHPAEGAEVAPGRAEVLVRAFDSCRDVAKVELDAGDGRGWQPMKRDTEVAWSLGAELRGAGKVAVRATDSAGETWEAASSFRAGGAAPEVVPGTDWPVWGGTPENRRATADRVAPPLRLAWRAAPGGRCHGPVVSGSRIYAAVSTQDFEENNAILCLEAATGREIWRARLDGSPMCPPAVTAGVVGAIDRCGRAYGFDAATGVEKWRVAGLAGTFATYGKSGMITAADGVFYAGNLHALAAADGRQLWKAEVAQYADAPAAAAGGRVLGAGTGWQRCLSIKDGALLWKAPGASSYRASLFAGELALVGGKTVLGAADGKPAGMLKLASSGADGALSPDGKVFVAGSGSGRGQVTAVSFPDGRPLWSFPKGKEPALPGLSPITVAGDYAWFCAGGTLRAVSMKDGTEAWSFRLGARLEAPAVSGNAVFVTGDDGCVWALVGGAARKD